MSHYRWHAGCINKLTAGSNNFLIVGNRQNNACEIQNNARMCLAPSVFCGTSCRWFYWWSCWGFFTFLFVHWFLFFTEEPCSFSSLQAGCKDAEWLPSTCCSLAGCADGFIFRLLLGGPLQCLLCSCTATIPPRFLLAFLGYVSSSSDISIGCVPRALF